MLIIIIITVLGIRLLNYIFRNAHSVSRLSLFLICRKPLIWNSEWACLYCGNMNHYYFKHWYDIDTGYRLCIFMMKWNDILASYFGWTRKMNCLNLALPHKKLELWFTMDTVHRIEEMALHFNAWCFIYRCRMDCIWHFMQDNFKTSELSELCNMNDKYDEQ